MRSLAFELEGDLQPCPVGFHLTVLELQIQLDHFRDPQIAERLPRSRDCRGRRLLPRVSAGPDQLDDLVDALRHGWLLSAVLIAHLFDIQVSAGRSFRPPRTGRLTMAPRRGISRRRFLQSSLVLAGAGALPLRAAAPDLKLKNPIKVGCQRSPSGPLGGYGEFMRKGATLAMEDTTAGG